MRLMPTQREIARMSRVSQATVSRVLNNDPRVNEEARERVLAIVQEQDYAPNFQAQSLRVQRSGTLGLVVHRAPDALSQDPFFSPLVVAILQISNERGYHLCVDTARTMRSQRTIHEELLRTRRVDGLILVESRDFDERIARLVAGGFPFVLIGRYGDGTRVLSVDNDNVAAGRMVTEKLLADGHKHIAYIGGPLGVNVSEDRKTGYKAALSAAGLPGDNRLIVHGDFSSEGGQIAMRRLLANVPEVDAVIAVDDLTAAGAMRLARNRGVSVPEQIAFVGFNDSTFCSHLDTPLSSVCINIGELARQATNMLIDLIEQQPVDNHRRIVDSRLIERLSTRNVG